MITFNSYHSADTLRRVSAYQIGRIDESSWLNFTPPIRGGLFRKAVVDQEQDSEQDDTEGSSIDSKLGSLNSSATSLDILVDGQTEGFKKHVDTQILNAVATTTEGLTHRRIPSRKNEETSDRSSTSSDSKMTRDAYTAQVIQEEVDECIRDYPSLDAETQEAIRSKYHSLHERVKNEGYYDCRYIEYGKEAIRYSILFGLFIFTLRAGWYLTSSCFLGIFWHQIMFTAHDAGHRGITHNFVIDTLIGMFIADFTCGLSIGWWKSSHNVHHLITNHPVRCSLDNLLTLSILDSFDLGSGYYSRFSMMSRRTHLAWPSDSSS